MEEEVNQEEMEEEVSDAETLEVEDLEQENEAEMPNPEPSDEPVDLGVFIYDDKYWGQENKGERKLLSATTDDDGNLEVVIVNPDGSEKPVFKDMLEPMSNATLVFGDYIIAVDEYREKQKATRYAVSQALMFKNVEMSRHVTEVRLSAARELYGYLFNAGLKGRLVLLDTAKLPADKEKLENPRFFLANGGYEKP